MNRLVLLNIIVAWLKKVHSLPKLYLFREIYFVTLLTRKEKSHPCNNLMHCNCAIKRNISVKKRFSQEGDRVSTHCQQQGGEVEHQSGRGSPRKSGPPPSNATQP